MFHPALFLLVILHSKHSILHLVTFSVMIKTKTNYRVFTVNIKILKFKTRLRKAPLGLRKVPFGLKHIYSFIFYFSCVASTASNPMTVFSYFLLAKRAPVFWGSNMPVNYMVNTSASFTIAGSPMMIFWLVR